MEKPIKNFYKGLHTRFEPQSIPRGAASASLNWVTKGDRVELRRGMALLGDEIAGTGKSWVHVSRKADGTDIAFRKRGRKLEYYVESTDTWSETGTNLFPASAVADEPSWADYNSLAGAALYISSAHSSIYKVMLANPESYTDLQQTTFRGRIRIKNSRMFLWQRQDASGRKDDTGLYGSYIDKDEISDYTQIAGATLASGDGVTLAFSGTLAFKGVDALRTCFGLTITDGVETFTDDYNGVLTGSAGGTGTINYTTGAWAVTFAVAPANAPNNVTGTYYWEKSTTAGVVDFTKSSPRTAGQGFVLRQDDGGAKLQAVAGYQDKEYCLHERKTWVVNLTNDDTNATNLPFRNKVGIPSANAYCETGDGIFYVDDTDENESHIRLLTLEFGSTEVVPKDASPQLDLTGYRFDKAFMLEWGVYIVCACRTKDSTENNRLLVLDRSLKSSGNFGTWDVHDFYASSLAVLNGTLIGGDSATENVYRLFSGHDDDEATIGNRVEFNLDNLDTDRLKKAKKFLAQGGVGPDQTIVYYASPDNGPFVEICRIEGDGAYVDRSQRISVGALTIGRAEIGGGGLDGEVTAYNYEREVSLALDRFEQVMIAVETEGLGYASVSRFSFRDVRDKGPKSPSRYRG